MKKFLTLTVIVLFALIVMATGVQAADVSDAAALENALAGEEETIKLMSDLTIDSNIVITNSKAKTLDLNGKTLTLNKSLALEGGNLTITGNGKILSEVVRPLISVKAGSTLVLENGEYSTTKYGASVIAACGSTNNDGTNTNITVEKDAKISGNYAITVIANAGYGVKINVYGTLEGITENDGWNYGSMAIAINGTNQPVSENASIINIYEGAKLSAAEGNSGDVNDDAGVGIYGAGYANWNIFGGEITGSEALSIKSGNFNITGGTLTATGKFVDPATAEGSGSEATGSAISITKNSGYTGNVKISITNANVSSKNGYAISEQTTRGTGTAVESIQISGGNFTGKEGAVSVKNTDSLGKFITGGTFNTSVSEYVEDTVTSVPGDNGEVLVGTLNAIEVKTTENGTVGATLEKAVKGQKVKITATPAEGYRLSGDIKVYDANNNSIEVVDGEFIMPDGKVFVEVEFEEEQNPGQTPDDGEKDPGQTPDDGEQTPGQTPDDGEQNPGQTPDDGEQTPGQTPDDGEQTPGQTPDDGEKDPEQTPDDGEEEKEDAKDTTPETGLTNIASYAVVAAVAIIAIIAIKKQKIARHSK